MSLTITGMGAWCVCSGWVYTCQSHSLCIGHNVSATENCWDHLHLNRCGDLHTHTHRHHTTCMLHEHFAEAVSTVYTHTS